MYKGRHSSNSSKQIDKPTAMQGDKPRTRARAARVHAHAKGDAAASSHTPPAVTGQPQQAVHSSGPLNPCVPQGCLQQETGSFPPEALEIRRQLPAGRTRALVGSGRTYAFLLSQPCRQRTLACSSKPVARQLIYLMDATAFVAASSRSSAAITSMPLVFRIFLPASTLVPSNRTIWGV